jgi:hypothetical protein
LEKTTIAKGEPTPKEVTKPPPVVENPPIVKLVPTGKLPPLPAWTAPKPLAQGESALDRLEAKEIPSEERFDWQRKELVAVIGKPAHKHWAGQRCLHSPRMAKQR